MIYKFLAAVLLLTSSISGYDSETGYENGVIRSQMQKLMSGFVNTVDYAKVSNNLNIMHTKCIEITLISIKTVDKWFDFIYKKKLNNITFTKLIKKLKQSVIVQCKTIK